MVVFLVTIRFMIQLCSLIISIVRNTEKFLTNKITANLIGQAGMLVNVYVETFKIDVMVFVGKVNMYLMSPQF